jgi:hypothetical protein
MQPKFPKDLSTSNAITVNNSSEMYPLRPNTEITLPHKRYDEDDVADIKVMKILEQRFRRHTSSTSTYSHTHDNHDDS